jgi:hypothetical protein
MVLLATITIEVVTFRAYGPFPALLSFFKFILEVVIYEGVKYKYFASIATKYSLAYNYISYHYMFQPTWAILK